MLSVTCFYLYDKVKVFKQKSCFSDHSWMTPSNKRTLIFRLYTAHKHANVVLYTQQPTYTYIFHTYQSVKLSFFSSSFARSCEARQLRLQKTTFTLNLNFFSLLFGAQGKLFRVAIFGLQKSKCASVQIFSWIVDSKLCMVPICMTSILHLLQLSRELHPFALDLWLTLGNEYQIETWTLSYSTHSPSNWKWNTSFAYYFLSPTGSPLFIVHFFVTHSH